MGGLTGKYWPTFSMIWTDIGMSCGSDKAPLHLGVPEADMLALPASWQETDQVATHFDCPTTKTYVINIKECQFHQRIWFSGYAFKPSYVIITSN